LSLSDQNEDDSNDDEDNNSEVSKYEHVITADGLKEYFPFGTNPAVFEPLDLEEGLYKFEIIDCGQAIPVEVDYKKSTVKDFGYTSTNGCQGIYIYPKGSIYLGETDRIQSYFRIAETPPGIAAINDITVEGGSPLLIKESGRYVLQISEGSTINSCPFDTLVINYTKQSFSQDTDSIRHYICDENTGGYIRMKHKGGVGPFTYELFDKGVFIEQNETGIFHYGNFGETYQIKIRDTECRLSLTQDVTMLNLGGEKLVNDDFAVCTGEEIQLKCSFKGAYEYSWSGPGGYVSTEQNPTIPDATGENAGVYSIQILPEGCSAKLMPQYVNVDVVDPLPLPDTTIFYCLNDKASVLSIIPDHGNYLKWYGDDTVTLLPSAPIPETSRVDTVEYFVSQVNSMLGCEGEKSPVKVIVLNFPEAVAAVSPDICPGQYPVIEIENTLLDYTYNIYSASSELVGVGQGTGDSLKITLSEPISESAFFYVETVSLQNCASSERPSVKTTVFNYMYIMPDKIPQYQRGKPYSAQLETNAVPPYEFYTETLLPSGFSLSAAGLISGTAPPNGQIDPVPFIVKAKDVNGCFAEKEYVLKSSIFIPQAFTPNGDGDNDVFMKGRRLVIFDRLGLKIFEGSDGWDGSRMDGTPAPPDTYFYLIYYEDENLQTGGQIKGYITLIRRR
jgi:gliding motility-associated-like protein